MARKKVKCNLCGGKKHEKIAKKDKNTKIVECKNCGLIFVDPMPSDQYINKIYQKKYYSPADKPYPEISNHLKQRPFLESYFKKEIARIKKIKKKGKILDIGCGPGFFLNIAKSAGFKVFGSDISKFAAKYAKEKFKLDVFGGELNQAKFLTNFFDVITIYQTIEHVKNPLKFLKEVSRILKKDGLLILTTPNQDNFIARILVEKWFGYYYLSHLYFFNPKSVKKILKKAGFKKVKLTSNSFSCLSIAESLERFYHFYPSSISNFFADLIKPMGKLVNLRIIPLTITGKSMRVEGFKNI